MGLALFVSSLLLSVFRLLLNAIDPYLSLMNIHLVEKPPSSVETLLAAIRAKSGSLPSLAQNPQWRERLQLTLDFIGTKGDLNPFGRWIVYRYLLTEINALECFETISKKFPQVAIGETHRPVFIFGLPRSGTTLLHHLLSLYPNVFSPTTSQTIFHGMSLDDVREASSLVDLRRRMKMASKRHAFGFKVFANGVVSIPYSVHPTEPFGPEECTMWLNKYVFAQPLPVARDDFVNVAERYGELSDQAYGLYKRDLHIMESIDCPNADRFVLKAPFHMMFSDVILRHWPDACFVRMHRDPVDVVASVSSLVRICNSPFCRRTDSLKLGRDARKTIRGFASGLVRQTSTRMPECTIDVRFDEFVRDPVGVCKNVACRVGLEHTEEMDEKLTAFLIEDKAKRAKAGKHVYSLEEFGLNAAEIRKDCKEYCDKFAL